MVSVQPLEKRRRRRRTRNTSAVIGCHPSVNRYEGMIYNALLRGPRIEWSKSPNALNPVHTLSQPIEDGRSLRRL